MNEAKIILDALDYRTRDRLIMLEREGGTETNITKFAQVARNFCPLQTGTLCAVLGYLRSERLAKASREYSGKDAAIEKLTQQRDESRCLANNRTRERDDAINERDEARRLAEMRYQDYSALRIELRDAQEERDAARQALDARDKAWAVAEKKHADDVRYPKSLAANIYGDIGPAERIEELKKERDEALVFRKTQNALIDSLNVSIENLKAERNDLRAARCRACDLVKKELGSQCAKNDSLTTELTNRLDAHQRALQARGANGRKDGITAAMHVCARVSDRHDAACLGANICYNEISDLLR